MKVFRIFATILAAVSALGGCATGASYSAIASSIPTIKEGQGRVFFLRSSSVVGAVVQPEIVLNGAVVGRSQPGGFFFVDVPPGRYQATAMTEVESTFDFVLDSGEIKYIRTSPSLGILVGRIMFGLETKENAIQQMAGLSYTGTVDAASSPRVAAVSSRPELPRQQPSTIRQTTMEDLKGLLPVK